MAQYLSFSLSLNTQMRNACRLFSQNGRSTHSEAPAHNRSKPLNKGERIKKEKKVCIFLTGWMCVLTVCRLYPTHQAIYQCIIQHNTTRPNITHTRTHTHRGREREWEWEWEIQTKNGIVCIGGKQYFHRRWIVIVERTQHRILYYYRINQMVCFRMIWCVGHM